MDARTFKREVLKKAPPGVSREALDPTVESFLVEGKHEKYHIGECIQAAAALDREALPDNKDEDPFHQLAQVLPAAQGELLVKQVEPLIESIRRELFGKETPPFKSDETGYKKAVRWIKHEAEKQPKPPKKDQKRVQELEREIIDKQQERNRLTRQSVMSIGREVLIIPYADFSDRWVKKLAVARDKPLGPLAVESEKIAETTGFRQHMVVAWILAGIPPVLPGARLRMTMRPVGETFARQARIDIFSPDVKPSEIIELYKKAQAYLRPHHLSARNRALLGVIQELGDLKEGQEKRDYWETVRKEYNRRKPKGAKAYKNWEGPRKAFIRLESSYKEPFPQLEGRT